MTPEEAEDANLECRHMGERRRMVQERRWERIPGGDDPDTKSTMQAGARSERNIARQLKLVGRTAELRDRVEWVLGIWAACGGIMQRSGEDRSRQWSLYRYVIAETRPLLKRG